MQDKLKKILQIKIDAINKNIDNLNYLNGELDKNNENLNYIKDKIALFKNNELLNFDQISKDDFEKLLLMIDPAITEVFRDKTCSYDGIIYIIEGIRKSISLQLTENQTNAILSFVEGMKLKSINLQDVINNLIESKNRLPEIDLDTLTMTLDNYENIVSKYENNEYLTEVDELEEALNFADSSLEEKVDIFEYLLKYNADIYNDKIQEMEAKEESEETNDSFDLPTFNYEPLNVKEFDSEFEKEPEIEETKKIEEPELNNEEEKHDVEDIQFNLDQVFDNNDEV